MKAPPLRQAKCDLSPTAGDHAARQRPARLHTVATIIAAGFLINVIFHYVQGFYLGRSYPFNTCMFNPAVMFSDFTTLYQMVKDLKPYFPNFSNASNYFPLANLLFYPFTQMPNIAVALCLFLGGFVVLHGLLCKSLLACPRPQGTLLPSFVICFMSYPFLFNLDRANIEVLLWLQLAAFVIFYQQKRTFAAALFLAMAIAMKFFPVIFLLLYAARREWRTILLVITLTIVMTAVPLMIFEGGIVQNVAGLISSLRSVEADYIDTPFKLLQHSTTFFTFFRLMHILLYGSFMDASFKIPYTIGALVAMAPLSWFIVFREKSEWRRLYLTTFLFIAFPFISFDYRLIALLLPLFLLLNEPREERFARWYLYGFGLLLIAKDYVIFGMDVSLNVALNPLILTAMAGGIILESFLSKQRGRREKVTEESIGAIVFD